MIKYLLTLLLTCSIFSCVSTDSESSCSVGTPLTPQLQINNNIDLRLSVIYEKIMSFPVHSLDSLVTLSSLPREDSFKIYLINLSSETTSKDSVSFSTMSHNSYYLNIDEGPNNSLEFDITYKDKYCE